MDVRNFKVNFTDYIFYNIFNEYSYAQYSYINNQQRISFPVIRDGLQPVGGIYTNDSNHASSLTSAAVLCCYQMSNGNEEYSTPYFREISGKEIFPNSSMFRINISSRIRNFNSNEINFSGMRRMGTWWMPSNDQHWIKYGEIKCIFTSLLTLTDVGFNDTLYSNISPQGRSIPLPEPPVDMQYEYIIPNDDFLVKWRGCSTCSGGNKSGGKVLCTVDNSDVTSFSQLQTSMCSNFENSSPKPLYLINNTYHSMPTDSILSNFTYIGLSTGFTDGYAKCFGADIPKNYMKKYSNTKIKLTEFSAPNFTIQVNSADSSRVIHYALTAVRNVSNEKYFIPEMHTDRRGPYRENGFTDGSLYVSAVTSPGNTIPSGWYDSTLLLKWQIGYGSTAYEVLKSFGRSYWTSNNYKYAHTYSFYFNNSQLHLYDLYQYAPITSTTWNSYPSDESIGTCITYTTIQAQRWSTFSISTSPSSSYTWFNTRFNSSSSECMLRDYGDFTIPANTTNYSFSLHCAYSTYVSTNGSVRLTFAYQVGDDSTIHFETYLWNGSTLTPDDIS